MRATLFEFGCGTQESVTNLTQRGPGESYRRPMKNKKIFSPLIWLLLGSVALAQAGIADVPEEPRPQDPARIQTAKIERSAGGKAVSSSESPLISQARRYPQLHPGRMQAAGQAYHSPMPRLSPLGALIGFGAGAALGASKPQDGTSGGRVLGGLLLGGLGALIGGAVGNAPPFWHSRRNDPPFRPGEEDEDSNLSPHGTTIEAKSPVKKPRASSTPSAGEYGSELAGVAAQEDTVVP